MSCSYKKDQHGNHTILLAFRSKDLLYDIKNYAFIEGSVMSPQNAHNRHMVQDIGEEGNIDRIARVLDLCVSRCIEILYPYTKKEVKVPYVENRLRKPLEYTILLTVPKKVSQTTMILMEKIIHEYLVCESISEWLSITNPEKMPVWKAKAEDCLAEIRILLNARTGGLRRPMHPF